jgi:hypothetical protein
MWVWCRYCCAYPLYTTPLSIRLLLLHNLVISPTSITATGGVGPGINFPLRGEKHSNWEGGMRTVAFISGGFVPKELQGTSNGINMHIVDW